MGWAGLGWVGLGRNFEFRMGCVGLGWVTVYGSSHVRVYFYSTVQEEDAPPEKRARLVPFADLRDGDTTSTSEQNAAARLWCEDELARYKAVRVPAPSSGPLEYWNAGRTQLENI